MIRVLVPQTAVYVGTQLRRTQTTTTMNGLFRSITKGHLLISQNGKPINSMPYQSKPHTENPSRSLTKRIGETQTKIKKSFRNLFCQQSKFSIKAIQAFSRRGKNSLLDHSIGYHLKKTLTDLLQLHSKREDKTERNKYLKETQTDTFKEIEI